MKNTIIDKRNGWEYELKGEQYYPTGRVMRDGKLQPETVAEDNGPEEEIFIGVWGQRHLRYIRQYKKSLYLNLFVSGTLNAYLAEIDAQAEDFFLWTVKEMAAREGVNETIKAKDQMRWIWMMNSVRNCATEIVNREIVYR